MPSRTESFVPVAESAYQYTPFRGSFISVRISIQDSMHVMSLQANWSTQIIRSQDETASQLAICTSILSTSHMPRPSRRNGNAHLSTVYGRIRKHGGHRQGISIGSLFSCAYISISNRLCKLHQILLCLRMQPL